MTVNVLRHILKSYLPITPPVKVALLRQLMPITKSLFTKNSKPIILSNPTTVTTISYSWCTRVTFPRNGYWKQLLTLWILKQHKTTIVYRIISSKYKFPPIDSPSKFEWPWKLGLSKEVWVKNLGRWLSMSTLQTDDLEIIPYSQQTPAICQERKTSPHEMTLKYLTYPSFPGEFVSSMTSLNFSVCVRFVNDCNS